MVNSFSYSHTEQISKLLTQIETLRQLKVNLPENQQIKDILLRHSTLKSSLFSARIEGNKLNLDQLGDPNRKSRDKQRLEVYQIYKAIKFVDNYNLTATSTFIRKIHQIIMENLTETPGKFRQESSAIFNQAGIAVYLAPSPSKIPQLIDELLNYIKTKPKNPGPVNAAIVHFTFEKIHPFLDGNGRVGRALTRWHLKKLGYDFKGLLSFETYFENHRELYYQTLANETRNITDFVEFFLEAISSSAQQLIIDSNQQEKPDLEIFLLPRRNEILAIIRDHEMITFDQISRRFGGVNTRTLHYDLQDLLKKGLIRKLGTTKGAVYSPAS